LLVLLLQNFEFLPVPNQTIFVTSQITSSIPCYVLYQWNFEDGSSQLYSLFTFASSIFYILLGIAIVQWKEIMEYFSSKSVTVVTDDEAVGLQLDHVDDSVLKEFKETVHQHDMLPEEAIRLIKVSKKYGSKIVVDNFTLRILQKESFGLLGPNGVGKSTILKILCDQESPSFGSVQVTTNTGGGISMGVCQQQNVFWEYLTVKGNLQFLGTLLGVPLENLYQWTKYVCSVCMIEKSMLSKYPIELSGGMKRRLAIGLALVGNPRIVILDEPTAGVDPKNKRKIWTALDAIRNDPDRCLLITSHFMDEVEHLCDRIAILKTGVLTVLGSKEDLKSKYGNTIRFRIMVKNTAPDSNFNGIQKEFYRMIGSNPDVCDVSIRKSGTSYYHTGTFLFDHLNVEILLDHLQFLIGNFQLKTFAILETSMDDVFRKVILGSK
jgi:ABC-type multidrug transport system ATPase subunit